MMRNTNKTVIYPAFHANVNTMMKMETKKKSYGKRKHEKEKNEIIKHTQFIKLKNGGEKERNRREEINERIFIFSTTCSMSA